MCSEGVSGLPKTFDKDSTSSDSYKSYKSMNRHRFHTLSINYYKPPFNFLACSLDKTHHLVQNRTTDVR